MTCLVSALGIAFAVSWAQSQDFPANVAAAAVPLIVFGYIVYRVTKNDYAWIELDGDTLRAKHLYTRWLVERTIGEIEDLRTSVFPFTLEGAITASLLGRVRAITIRFRDWRTPLSVSRADPAMKNAKELIEAVVYRMSEYGEVDTEIAITMDKPFIRRIYWTETPQGECEI
jgi:hypothetical protein